MSQVCRLAARITGPALTASHHRAGSRTGRTAREANQPIPISAHRRAIERRNVYAARKLGLPGRLARRRNCEGLDLIAAGLRRDGVAVF
jgi:hypothetical protein